MPENINLEEKLKSLEEKINVLSDIVLNGFKVTDENFEGLNNKVDSLHTNTSSEFKEVKVELKKIQSATGYNEYFSNMEVIKGKAQ